MNATVGMMRVFIGEQTFIDIFYTFQGRHKFTQPNDYSTYTTAVIIVSGVEQSRLLQAIDKDQITI